MPKRKTINNFKKNTPTILIIIGFILIFDGIISILFQIDESFLFQFGRYFRIFLGISLIMIVQFMKKNKLKIKK